jgi:hypothetical protein
MSQDDRLKVVCAFCGKLMKGDDDAPRVSHGACSRECFFAYSKKKGDVGDPKKDDGAKRNMDDRLRRAEREFSSSGSGLSAMLAERLRRGELSTEKLCLLVRMGDEWSEAIKNVIGVRGLRLGTHFQWGAWQAARWEPTSCRMVGGLVMDLFAPVDRIDDSGAEERLDAATDIVAFAFNALNTVYDEGAGDGEFTGEYTGGEGLHVRLLRDFSLMVPRQADGDDIPDLWTTMYPSAIRHMRNVIELACTRSGLDPAYFFVDVAKRLREYLRGERARLPIVDGITDLHAAVRHILKGLGYY